MKRSTLAMYLCFIIAMGFLTSAMMGVKKSFEKPLYIIEIYNDSFVVKTRGDLWIKQDTMKLYNRKYSFDIKKLN